MRRALLPWLIALGLAVLAGVGAVAVLNATVFGAGSFVRVYLDALARGDVSEALTLPGVRTSGPGDDSPGVDAPGADAPSAALLHDGTLAGLRDIRQLGDEERDGSRLLTFGWSTPHGSGTTTFRVERIGTRFGLFPEWGFATSPMATVRLTVAHDARFTVNGVDEVSSTRANTPVDYAVLVPGSYAFAHTSRYLTASPDFVLADTVNRTLIGRVETRANAAFVSTVSSLVNAQLRQCATQAVLFPTGCSFGQSVDDRVSSAPKWSIVAQPDISIVPGERFGTWAIPPTPGTAHLAVTVTSLFDGSTSSFDQDVPFMIAADITLSPDDAITVIQR